MMVETAEITRGRFETGTGWDLRPEGACRGEVCIPLPDATGDTVDVAATAAAMGLPLVRHEGLIAVGPWGGSGRTLVSAEAPELTLPDLDGNAFRLSSLRGQKVLLLAWAPY